MPAQRKGPRCSNIYPLKDGRFRFNVYEHGGSKPSRTPVYATEAQAAEAKRALDVIFAHKAQQLTIDDAIKAYLEHRKKRRLHWKTHGYRLRRMLGPIDAQTADAITAAKCRRLYARFCSEPTRRGKPPSDDYQINSLSYTRTFWNWLVKQGHCKSNPWDSVERIGKKTKGGKDQLMKAEAIKLRDACLRDLSRGSAAVLTVLFFGMRSASECGRVRKRHIDLDELYIDGTKTDGSQRRVEFPPSFPQLKARLDHLCQGLAPNDLVFVGPGSAELDIDSDTRAADSNRKRFADWLLRECERLCELAGIPRVVPQGLRCTAISLALRAGQVAEGVAQATGNTVRVQQRHYAGPGARQTGDVSRRGEALSAGAKGAGDA